MVRFFSKKNENANPLDKRNALDGLLGKLDSQLNSEQQRGTSFKRSNRSDPIMPSGINQLGQRGAGKQMNPFASPTLRSNSNPINPPRTSGIDPLTMNPKVSKARKTNAMRKARHNQINQIRHRGGNFTTTTNPNGDPDEYIGGNEADDEDDLKVVDEGSYKTMEWTEPDGSITILKFDEDGALIGKEKKSNKKQRPSKFQQDLKDKLEAEERKAEITLRKMENERRHRQQRAVSSAQIASGSRPKITRQEATATTLAQQRQRSLRQGIVGGGF